MPFWKGAGRESLFTATNTFFKQMREEDPVVSRTMDTLEHLASLTFDEMVYSSVSAFAKILVDAAGSYGQANIAYTEGLDLTPQPPRLPRRSRTLLLTDTAPPSPSSRRQLGSVEGTLTPDRPRLTKFHQQKIEDGSPNLSSEQKSNAFSAFENPEEMRRMMAKKVAERRRVAMHQQSLEQQQVLEKKLAEEEQRSHLAIQDQSVPEQQSLAYGELDMMKPRYPEYAVVVEHEYQGRLVRRQRKNLVYAPEAKSSPLLWQNANSGAITEFEHKSERLEI